MSDQARTFGDLGMDVLIAVARAGAKNGGADLDERMDTVGILRADIADICSQAARLDAEIGSLVAELSRVLDVANGEYRAFNSEHTGEAIRNGTPFVNVRGADWHAGYLGGYASGVEESLRIVRLALQGITR